MKLFGGDSGLSNAGNAIANYAGQRSGLLGGYNYGKENFSQPENPFAQFTNESTEDDNAKVQALNTNLIGTTPQPIAPTSAAQKSSGVGSLLGMLLAAI